MQSGIYASSQNVLFIGAVGIELESCLELLDYEWMMSLKSLREKIKVQLG